MRLGGELGPLLIIALVVSLTVFYDGGLALLRKGGMEGGKMLARFIPLFVVAFFVVGQSKVLMDKHIDVQRLDTWLSGGKGILFALFSGIVTPVILPLFPLLKSMWDQNVGRLAIIMFLMALALNWQVLLFRVPLLGWGVTLVSLGSTLLTLMAAAAVLLIIERLGR